MSLLFIGGDFTHRNEVKAVKQFPNDLVWYTVNEHTPTELLAKADVLHLKSDFTYTRSTGMWKDVGGAMPRIVPRTDIIEWSPGTKEVWEQRERDAIQEVQKMTLREFTEDVVKKDKKDKKDKVPFKYDEERLLKEFNDYVGDTYSKHYVGEDNIQSLDLIFATGHGEGFCTGNILKYGARQGKKAGQQRDDIMKTLHYALLLLYWYDKQEAKKHGEV